MKFFVQLTAMGNITPNSRYLLDQMVDKLRKKSDDKSYQCYYQKSVDQVSTKIEGES
jgi:hypothetical protein